MTFPKSAVLVDPDTPTVAGGKVRTGGPETTRRLLFPSLGVEWAGVDGSSPTCPRAVRRSHAPQPYTAAVGSNHNDQSLHLFDSEGAGLPVRVQPEGIQILEVAIRMCHPMDRTVPESHSAGFW